LADVGEGEEGFGGAVGGGGVAVADLFGEGVEGGGEEGAEAVGGVFVDLAAGAVEGLDEGGVLVSPAVEGAAVDLQRLGNLLIGFTSDE
jgi:hypothetical protein